ncbi:MAG: hypothetical protein PHE27_06310 [Alphaproteobacteria bacterium]|nr:hypothetical protein [Alphaproteobacteria bacterium]
MITIEVMRKNPLLSVICITPQADIRARSGKREAGRTNGRSLRFSGSFGHKADPDTNGGSSRIGQSGDRRYLDAQHSCRRDIFYQTPVFSNFFKHYGLKKVVSKKNNKPQAPCLTAENA